LAAVAALLIAVNEGIVPDPDEAKPIVWFVFTQLYTAPVAFPEGTTEIVEAPAHKVCEDIALTCGKGFTPSVKEIGVPTQDCGEVGVTVIVPDNGDPVVLVAVKDAIEPVPDAAKPIAGLVLVQA
jgi:hypothetical protein